MKKISFLAGLLALLLVWSNCSAQQDESFWPKKVEGEKGTATIYQPQIESFSGDKLEARAAVSITETGVSDMVFGAMWFSCRVSTDYDTRMVSLQEVTVSAAKFPDVDQEKIDNLSRYLEEEMPKWEMVISLDALLEELKNLESANEIAENMNNKAPEIIFATTPSALILIDGDPVWKETDNTDYQYVVNTPFFIVKQASTGKYFLKGGNHWYKTTDLKGEWINTENPPRDLVKLAEKAMGDQKEEEAESDTASNVVPKIYLRTTPAELLQAAGEPQYAPVESTSLLYMTNCPQVILMDINSQLYYILISGRWYSGKSLTANQWQFIAADKLPADFANIPKNSDIAAVRSSVAGTPEAQEAVLEAQIPQTAKIDRSSATLEVKYDGTPKFEPIGETGMKYAVNTDKSVLLIDGKYYCCDDAVWFESGSPNGPWTVSSEVPDKVQDIPPDNPTYNVKYVYIYDSTPDVVYVGYTPGYCYSYIYGPTVIYGTGWYYRPWFGVYYYPRPVTYGFGVTYNPYMGWSFSFGITFGGPVGWYSFGYHPPYHGWWGPAGYRAGYNHGYYHGYNQGYARGYMHGKYDSGNYNRGDYNRGNRPTTYDNVNNNVYKNRSNGVAQTGDRQYNPKNGQQINTNDKSTRTTRPAQPTTSEKNNVLTDKDGNVYRKEGDSWQQRDQGQWKDVDRNTKDTRTSQPKVDNLDRDYNSRSQGQNRTQQYNQNRSSYQNTRPSTSYSRPSTGGSYRGGRR